MGTGGSIAAILGAMLLGGMGKGMFQGAGEDESSKKLPSDPQVLKMKQKNVETPEALDVQAMMAKHAPGQKATFDNINRVSASMPKDTVSEFEPISDAQLMGDPMQQHMANFNYEGTGPAITQENRPPSGDRSLKQMYADEKIYGPEKQKSYKQMIAEQPKEIEGPKEQGMIAKLIGEIMKGKQPNPEAPYTNRGAF